MKKTYPSLRSGTGTNAVIFSPSAICNKSVMAIPLASLEASMGISCHFKENTLPLSVNNKSVSNGSAIHSNFIASVSRVNIPIIPLPR